MEPLIFGLIVMAISAFFTNKKKEEKDIPDNGAGRMQTNRNKNQGGFKRMEDYAKEIYGEFQTQMKPGTDKKEQVKQAAQQVIERETNRRQVREAASATEKRASAVVGNEIGGRLSRQQKFPRNNQETAVKESDKLFPLSQSEAQKAIVYAEIFMPPKSKRP